MESKTNNESFGAVKALNLINGSQIPCFPKADLHSVSIDYGLQLDTTGQHLSVGEPKKRKEKLDKKSGEEPSEQQERETYFLERAHYFLSKAETIMSDSRMFLAPVPIQSGLAYSGSSGFRNPTLGVYVEWWLHYGEQVTIENEGSLGVTYQIAGSPLSGSNRCGIVYPDGHTERFSFRKFIPIWKSFMSVNNRYTAAKQSCDAYTMEEVYELLVKADESREAYLSMKLDMEETKHRQTALLLCDLKEHYEKLTKLYHDACLELHDGELAELKREIEQHKGEMETERAVLMAEIAGLKARWEAGEMSLTEYQKEVHPLASRRKRLKRSHHEYTEARIAHLMEKRHITREIITKYLL